MVVNQREATGNERSSERHQPRKRCQVQVAATESQAVANDSVLVDDWIPWDGLPDLALSVLERVFHGHGLVAAARTTAGLLGLGTPSRAERIGSRNHRSKGFPTRSVPATGPAERHRLRKISAWGVAANR